MRLQITRLCLILGVLGICAGVTGFVVQGALSPLPDSALLQASVDFRQVTSGLGVIFVVTSWVIAAWDSIARFF